ncbi:putative ethanolamine-phosphate cytidylyltransferase [Ceratocystis fimbriata CBS 114723]|uniref:ethanolamine-phosphate cytidylyltransferase n=1 Tax=Ceratocystis fimbriata CBS 114723 TaxID=1035309 RepID=A0A2C5WTD9_9PEZI|nr:putative ethanolamine-phosphate cytidylyltransferase [Ceratocystis fimbriata CBS 114723]
MASTIDPPPGTPAPEILENRIWIDGCFDFFHHGHAGAIVQARQLGNELFVGVHSDEAIMENKGPTVMTLDERLAAVEACRWVTRSVTHAPYVTDLDWISHFGCKYVVHGDDITSDSSGEDCYRFVKAANRFKVVKRTPSISTTDLVGRMLLCTRTHFIKSLSAMISGEEGAGTPEERAAVGSSMKDRMKLYATDASGSAPGCDVWFWNASDAAKTEAAIEEAGIFERLFEGKGPKPGQRVVYVDGGFDLFSSGHIEFLKRVTEAEEKIARDEGWYSEQAVNERLGKGEDYPPAYVVTGIHDDEVINQWKGVNYPIMNIFERGLCVLQCRYVHAAIFGAPFSPSKSYLAALPWGVPDAVYHGPTSFMPLTYDPYQGPKTMGIFKEIPTHSYKEVNAGTIVQRITRSREMYEARQRAKGIKAQTEEAHRAREILEEEQRAREAARAVAE